MNNSVVPLNTFMPLHKGVCKLSASNVRHTPLCGCIKVLTTEDQLYAKLCNCINSVKFAFSPCVICSELITVIEFNSIHNGYRGVFSIPALLTPPQICNALWLGNPAISIKDYEMYSDKLDTKGIHCVFYYYILYTG